MSATTNISYVDSTFNPWYGCTKVSAGCKNCFAERWAARFKMAEWGPGKPRRMASEAKWREALRWSKHDAVFSLACKCGDRFAPASLDALISCPHCKTPGSQMAARPRRILTDLCDWLDRDAPPEYLAKFLGLIQRTPNLQWMLLTKRPNQFMDRLQDVITYMYSASGAGPHDETVTDSLAWRWLYGQAPSNVWFGVSCENQNAAEWRIEQARRIPAVRRWVSFEPLIGPIQLSGVLMDGIHFAVIGGESCKPRSDARPCDVSWIRKMLDTLRRYNIPTHVKQIGSNTYVPAPYGPVEHWQGGDPSEWPADLRPYHEVKL